MSVRLHYPEVFDGSSVMDLIILMIGLKASVISNKDLIGRSGWRVCGQETYCRGADSGLVTNFPWTIARQVIRLRQHIC
jgi:hypothetical protein